MTHAITPPQARPIRRFLDAQRVHYPKIVREIRQGRKRTHWMWYVFPQLSRLAKSETSRYYGIADQAEALDYLNDPTLRLRLAECTMGVLSHDKLMLPPPDDRKLQACMTLFRTVAADPTLPNAVLDKFYGGRPDQRTLDILAGTYVEPQTAMGRVEMGKHWEKKIRAAQSTVEQIGLFDRTEPMLRGEVESFIRGFNLSAPSVKLIVDAWMADQEQARDQGYHDCREEAFYDAP